MWLGGYSVLIKDIYNKYKYCVQSDRIGPDLLFTHWKLHFTSSMKKLCHQKMMYFSPTAEVRPGVYIDYCSRIKLGDNVVLRPNTMLFANETTIIDIEDDVMLGSGVHIYTDNHTFNRTDIPIIEQGHQEYKSVTIRKGSWIGANSIILTGVTIGRNSVIGAGSVVTKNVPDFTVVAGSPAKVIRTLK